MAQLPNEMLAEVCRALIPTMDEIGTRASVIKRATLYNLMRSTKALYHIASPFMYHTLDSASLSLEKFFQIYTRNPKVAQLVRVASLENMEPSVFTVNHLTSHLTINAILPALEKSSISPSLRNAVINEWRPLLRGKVFRLTRDLQLALFMILCTKLECLEVKPYQAICERFVRGVLHDVAASASSVAETSPQTRRFRPLQHLKTLHIGSPAMRGYRAQFVSNLLQLPALETFISDVTVEDNWYAAPPFRMGSFSKSTVFTKMRKIDLSKVHFIAADFENFLVAIPSLRELRLEFLYQFSTISDVLDLGNIGDLLRQYCTRLESLDLAFRSFRDYPVRGSIGDLRVLGQLRELRLVTNLVHTYLNIPDIYPRPALGTTIADILPDSLEAFELVQHSGGWKIDGGFDPQLMGLMTSERLRSLRRIVMPEYFRYFPWPPWVSRWGWVMDRNTTQRREWNKVSHAKRDSP